MIKLQYSPVIEATEDPSFFVCSSPDLEGFTGTGHSIEDCLYNAKWGMEEHVTLLKEHNRPIPSPNPAATILIQNERKLESVSRSCSLPLLVNRLASLHLYRYTSTG